MRRILGCLAAFAVVVFAAAANPRPSGGTVTGKVTYTGMPAKQKVIDMSKEPSCAKQHATPITTETVLTGPSDSLENVMIYISAGAADEGGPSQAVRLEQKGCQYIPDPHRRDVSYDRIGCEGLRAGEDFHVHRVTHGKVLFRFQKRSAYSQISNARGPVAGSGNGRTHVRLHVDA